MSVETVEIVEPNTGYRATITPSLGFNCFRFTAQSPTGEWEVLWNDPQFLTGTTRPSRSGIPILFPFAGRLRGTTLNHQGRTFTFDVTDPLGNAIHGFVYTRAWRVIDQKPHSVTGEFHASRDDASLLARWPSDFRIRATYSLARQALQCKYEITNTGDSILPWGLGTHPYFRLPLGEQGIAEDCTLQVPLTHRWELENMLPTGKVLPVSEAASYAEGIRIGKQLFDDVFTGLTHKVNGIWEGSVHDSAHARTTAIRFGEPFSECVVFIPPHREAICIEPYSCVSNAFELESQGIATNLQRLAPGESRTCHVDIVAR